MDKKRIAIASMCAFGLGAGTMHAEGDYKTEPAQEAQRAPVEDVDEATEVVQQMKQDDDIRDLLTTAKGVLIIPDYVAVALVAGGEDGEGVLFKQNQDGWSDPAFYDLGGGSLGLQAGVSAGSFAMILMSDEALQGFMDENNFALNADAGLTIFNWSARARAEVGKGADIVVWTDTEGLLADAAVGVSNVSFDEEENRAYYNRQVTPREILFGDVQNPHQEQLGKEFAAAR